MSRRSSVNFEDVKLVSPGLGGGAAEKPVDKKMDVATDEDFLL